MEPIDGGGLAGDNELAVRLKGQTAITAHVFAWDPRDLAAISKRGVQSAVEVHSGQSCIGKIPVRGVARDNYLATSVDAQFNGQIFDVHAGKRDPHPTAGAK